MQIGMIGLGRMGANMVRRLLKGGHHCVVFDASPKAVKALVNKAKTKERANGAASLADLVQQLKQPRAIWMMIPGAFVDALVADLLPHLDPGDILIDGGNSYYVDDIRIAKKLARNKIDYLDCGTSGGVLGLERGYCLMIGGAAAAVKHLDPIFKTLAPGRGDIPRTPGRGKRGGSAEQGYLHCGPSGAGHFVKMVHNGIEYGLMAAYAEGMNILAHANVGNSERSKDAETTPLRNPRGVSIRFRPARYRRSLAARQRDRLVVAGPERIRPEPGSNPGRVRRPRLGFRRRALDDQGRDRRRGAGAGAQHRAVFPIRLAGQR